MKETSFDILTDEFEDIPATTPRELMIQFESATACDPAQAYQLGCRLVEARYYPAALSFAKFLRTTSAKLPLNKSRRLEFAEYLLMEQLNWLDTEDKEIAKLSNELSALHLATGRPIAGLADLLRTIRYGGAADKTELRRMAERVKKLDINQMGVNTGDCLALAKELEFYTSTDKMTELFYTLASESDDVCIAGQAHLALGDFYIERAWENPGYVQEAYMHYGAAGCGFPEYISW